jgi:hypothetical protein
MILGPSAGTLAARDCSVVEAFSLMGAGRGASFGVGVCHFLSSHLSSWLLLKAL